MYRRLIGLLAAICSLAAGCALPAWPSRPLTVILADHLSYQEIATSELPATVSFRRRACVALLSPGLPNALHGTPTGNLHASLSAGDMIDASNDHAGLLERQLAASGADMPGGVRFVQFGDVAAPGRLGVLRSLLASSSGSVLLVGVTPVEGRDGGGRVYWNSLTPVVWLDPPAMTDAVTTLSSPTTHTVGLIALRDVAPSILSYEGLPLPASMSGHSAFIVEFPYSSDRDPLLARIDTLSRTNAEAQHPFGWIYGLGGGAILLAAVACVLMPERLARAARPMRYLARFLLAVTLAQLIVPWLALGDWAVYLLAMTAAALLLALIAGRIAPRNPLAPLLWTTAAAVILDAYAGTPLVSRALLSGYWLSGIRFYGIGNEFMGLLLGAALLAPVVGRNMPQPLGAAGKAALAAWLAAALIALAYPQFGAKAGGAVTASAAFIPAWWALARGREVAGRVWVLSVLAGFALVFAFAAVSHLIGGRDTHIQDAVRAVSQHRFGYIAHVAARKAEMAARIAIAPGTLTGIAGVGLLYALWLRSDLKTCVNRFLASRTDLRRALVAGCWGMLACVLFNDSGAAAMLLMGGVLALSLLHEMLTELMIICAYLPSTSATSASELPSATSLSSPPTL